MKIILLLPIIIFFQTSYAVDHEAFSGYAGSSHATLTPPSEIPNTGYERLNGGEYSARINNYIAREERIRLDDLIDQFQGGIRIGYGDYKDDPDTSWISRSLIRDAISDFPAAERISFLEWIKKTVLKMPSAHARCNYIEMFNGVHHDQWKTLKSVCDLHMVEFAPYTWSSILGGLSKIPAQDRLPLAEFLQGKFKVLVRKGAIADKRRGIRYEDKIVLPEDFDSRTDAMEPMWGDAIHNYIETYKNLPRDQWGAMEALKHPLAEGLHGMAVMGPFNSLNCYVVNPLEKISVARLAVRLFKPSNAWYCIAKQEIIRSIAQTPEADREAFVERRLAELQAHPADTRIPERTVYSVTDRSDGPVCCCVS